MIPLSVLDLAPVPEGGNAGQALRNSFDLARHVEALGYQRYWMAEHHNMSGIASAATAVALAHIATGTSTIRIGAGGVMLPNHAPLIIAEQFGTLAVLHPGRIDLGLGRAPGSDQIAARAMRRNLHADADQFPQDVMELLEYFRPAVPGQALQAVPGAGEAVEIWILGSSTFGAQLAAMLSLPYAFASHFAPEQLPEAVATYRARFRPSQRLVTPHVMLGVNVFAAETDAEALRLFSSLQQAFLNLRRGRPGKLPPPIDDLDAGLDPRARAMLAQVGAGGEVERVEVSFAEPAAGLLQFAAARRPGGDRVVAVQPAGVLDLLPQPAQRLVRLQVGVFERRPFRVGTPRPSSSSAPRWRRAATPSLPAAGHGRASGRGRGRSARWCRPGLDADRRPPPFAEHSRGKLTLHGGSSTERVVASRAGCAPA